MRLPTTTRPGVSLLEAMIAVTILFITVFAVSQLMDQANQQANKVRDRSLAMQLAQSKLQEIESGALPLTSGGGAFNYEPNWQWTLEATQNTEINGLWYVTLQVQRQDSDTPAATLSKIILDPSSRGNSTDQPQIQGTSGSSSSGSSSSGQSGSTTPSTPAASGGATPSSGSTSKPSSGSTAKPSGGSGGTPSGGTAKPSGGSGGTGGSSGSSKPTTGTSSGGSKPATGTSGTSGASGR